MLTPSQRAEHIADMLAAMEDDETNRWERFAVWTLEALAELSPDQLQAVVDEFWAVPETVIEEVTGEQQTLGFGDEEKFARRLNRNGWFTYRHENGRLVTNAYRYELVKLEKIARMKLEIVEEHSDGVYHICNIGVAKEQA